MQTLVESLSLYLVVFLTSHGHLFFVYSAHLPQLLHVKLVPESKLFYLALLRQNFLQAWWSVVKLDLKQVEPFEVPREEVWEGVRMSSSQCWGVGGWMGSSPEIKKKTVKIMSLKAFWKRKSNLNVCILAHCSQNSWFEIISSRVSCSETNVIHAWFWL